MNKPLKDISLFTQGVAMTGVIGNIIYKFSHGDNWYGLTWVLVLCYQLLCLWKDYHYDQLKRGYDSILGLLNRHLKNSQDYFSEVERIRKEHEQFREQQRKQYYGTKEDTPGRANPDGQ